MLQIHQKIGAHVGVLLGFIEQFVRHVLDVEAVNVMDENNVLEFAVDELGHDIPARILGMDNGLKAALAVVDHDYEITMRRAHGSGPSMVDKIAM